MNTKFLKAGLVAAMVVMVTGCASMDASVKSNVANAHKLAKNTDGVTVGLVSGSFSANPVEDGRKVCESIGNSDARCSVPGVKSFYSLSAFGFSAAAAGVVALAPADVDFKPCGTPGGEGCFYAKVKAEPGKPAALIKLYKEGENGCHWSGMPRAGGVVCNDWDYRKDMRDWDTTNGVMTVKD